MKQLLFSILLSISLQIQSQTVIAYDYMETWNWPGLWFGNTFNSTWATNASVTPTTSAVIYGAGNGSSGFEQDWYVLPNITGLDPSKLYQFKFRLASYRFTSTNSTRGVDAGDFIEVQASYDGEITYVNELRIRGNNNAYWDYNTTGIINHQADGVFQNSAFPTGDIYQSGAGNQTGIGYSIIQLNLPVGITQIAIDIFCRVNAAGEEWWIDDIELIEINALPVTLTSFTVKNSSNTNILQWTTSTEQNSSHFYIERSTTGEFTENSIIEYIQAAGTTSTPQQYAILDKTYNPTINYYRLVQVDLDGKFVEYGPIMIDNRQATRVVKLINTAGQQVNEDATGILFEIYNDGTVKKIFK